MAYRPDLYTVSELAAIYDNSQSFYHKALVKHDRKNGYIILQSYNTDVCMIDNFGKFRKLWDGYSHTTMRHINEFIEQYGVKGGGKKWWDSLPTAR